MQGIWCGSYEYLKTVEVRDREEIDEHPEQETFPVSVEKVGDERLQGECVLSKLDMACIDGDNEELSEENRRQGSDPQCLLCCISATKERTYKATIVVYEVEKSDSVGDETELKTTFESTSRARKTCQLCLRCVTAMTEENS